jgi:hypothetical protein
MRTAVVNPRPFLQKEESGKIEVDYRSTDRRVPGFSGWAQYDPENQWVLSGFDFRYRSIDGTTGSKAATFEYRQNAEKHAILKRIELRWRNSRGYDGQHVYDFDFHDGHAPESEFTLSEFGFPEPGGVPPAKLTPWFLWFSLAGGGCLLAGVLLRWRARRNGA